MPNQDSVITLNMDTISDGSHSKTDSPNPPKNASTTSRAPLNSACFTVTTPFHNECKCSLDYLSSSR